MSALDKLTDKNFERHVLDLIQRELGDAGWQKGLTVDQIVESIGQRKPA
ncbi:MAG: hypothetical protein ABSB35_07705 [Bryobacteraceae bacterium]|jgi:hypothetical protein